MAFYGDFTIEEAKDIGKQFQAVCKINYGYEYSLTVGREYLITIVPRILPMSPLCEFISDRGKLNCCHLERFAKKNSEING